MSFADDLRRIADSIDARAHLVVRKIIIDVGTALVMKSPVGDPTYWITPPPPGYVGGRFRANWQFGFGQYDSKTTEGIDKSGTMTIGRITSETPHKPAGGVFFITNSLPYGPRLETGWSRQAPHGMVRLTVVEFQPIVAAAVRALT